MLALNKTYKKYSRKRDEKLNIDAKNDEALNDTTIPF